jgi:putative Mn2+ efflux pump MntP
MSFSEISILAAGLAADSFALSLRDGMTFDKVTLKHALAVALSFGCSR